MFNFFKSIKTTDFLVPADFNDSNKVLKGNSADVKDLPVFNDGFCSVSCWQMNLRQALKLLFRRKIWLIVDGGESSPPVSLHIDYPISYNVASD